MPKLLGWDAFNQVRTRDLAMCASFSGAYHFVYRPTKNSDINGHFTTVSKGIWTVYWDYKAKHLALNWHLMDNVHLIFGLFGWFGCNLHIRFKNYILGKGEIIINYSGTNGRFTTPLEGIWTQSPMITRPNF